MSTPPLYESEIMNSDMTRCAVVYSQERVRVLCREGEDRDRSHAHAQARSQSSDQLNQNCPVMTLYHQQIELFVLGLTLILVCFLLNWVLAGESDASAAACGDARGTGGWLLPHKHRSHVSSTSP